MYTKTDQQNFPLRIIRYKELLEITGLSRTTIWRRIHAGEFPAPVSLGGKSVGWKFSQVMKWYDDLPRA